MAQINALVRHHEIVGEDKVTAPHLSGRWMTVQEFVSQSDRIASAISTARAAPAAAPRSGPATVPPRPDERTLTSITAPALHSNDNRKPESNAVLNLFEILQAARERKPQTPSGPAQPAIEMPRPVKSSSNGVSLAWIAIPALIVVAVAAWRMTSTPPAAAVAETETPTKTQAQKSAPVTASAPVAKPAVPARTVAIIPAVKPPVTHAPGFAVGRQALKVPTAPVLTDRERDRELEREREREEEREREREKERNEYARNNPANDSGRADRERDRERADELNRRDPASNRDDRLDRSTASAGGPDALPVTGGIPAEPNDFRGTPSESMSVDPSYR